MSLTARSLEGAGAELEYIASRNPSGAKTARGSTGTSGTQDPASQPDDTAPSFSAVFSQIAAEAAAAGTTVASIAGQSAAATSSTSASTTAPTTTASTTAVAGSSGNAGDPFGANPWLTDPTGNGPNGEVTNYNPIYFATEQTAEIVAQMVGGTVTESNQLVNAPGSPFTQNEENYMVQLPDGAQVNPGLIADIYTHGWNQDTINQDVANEVAGAEALVNG